MYKFLAVACIVFFAGCGGDGGGSGVDKEQCEAVINHFYDEGCEIFINQVEQSRVSMLADCYEDNSCGCHPEYNAWTYCLLSVQNPNCNTCDSKLNQVGACVIAKCD